MPSDVLCRLTTTPRADGRHDHVCGECGRAYVSRADRLMVECSLAAASSPPSLPRRLLNFSLALIRHVVAGNPTCTQQQIDDRLAICQTCPLWIATDNRTGYCGHQQCGCNASDQQTFLNKLAWSDQSCPLGYWENIENSTR